MQGVTKLVTQTVPSFAAQPSPMLWTEAIGADVWTVGRRSESGLGRHAPAVSDEVKIEIAREAVKKWSSIRNRKGENRQIVGPAGLCVTSPST